ncbi:MAG: TonB-dependent receptor [Bacteroidales bacterium]|nr:TonB-dependent receptor [Bacteroidales bacterium]
MKKHLMALAALLPLCAGLMAQNLDDSDIFSVKDNQLHSALDSIVVSASRVDAKSPVAFSEMDKRQLDLQNPSSSLAMMLNLQPSVVSVNEGGTGLGYSKIRVRGSDPTRMNVTLNGITYNDAESQEVFWVNLPSLSSMLNSAQLQRGVGSSINGVGAFGSSLNLQTAIPQTKPYAEFDLTGGSFYTAMAGVRAGTGRSRHGFSLDFVYNYNSTEGYIRNAFARLHSLNVVGSWYGSRSSAKIIYIHGRQRTGITWNGISKAQMEADRRYNPAGEYHDAAGNVCYYDNETDNYMQHIVQGIYSLCLAENLYGSATLNYTRGGGWYEQFKEDTKLSKYGYDTDQKSNLVRMKQMANDFYAGSANLKYETWRGMAQAGVNYSLYDGDHFGTLKWVEAMPDVDTERHYYDNNGLKKDLSAYLRGALYLLDGGLNIYGDAQWRHIRYRISGMDDDYYVLESNHPYDFFNAKVGSTMQAGMHGNVYVSAALAHKEPCRTDLKDAIVSGSEVRPERLLDYEFGYRYDAGILAGAINFYLMEYKDQLVATGKISSSGYKIKANVEKSYRRGVELSAGWKPFYGLLLTANSTFSLNKIVHEDGSLTDLMLSPGYVGAFSASWDATNRLNLTLTDKVVGSQYFDNSSNPEHKLPAYNVLNASASYDFGRLKIAVFANNLLNAKYVADAWYDYEWDDCGYFPAAPFNGMVKLSFKL